MKKLSWISFISSRISASIIQSKSTLTSSYLFKRQHSFRVPIRWIILLLMGNNRFSNSFIKDIEGSKDKPLVGTEQSWKEARPKRINDEGYFRSTFARGHHQSQGPKATLQSSVWTSSRCSWEVGSLILLHLKSPLWQVAKSVLLWWSGKTYHIPVFRVWRRGSIIKSRELNSS